MRTFNRHCAGVKVTLLKSESLFFYFSRRFYLFSLQPRTEYRATDYRRVCGESTDFFAHAVAGTQLCDTHLAHVHPDVSRVTCVCGPREMRVAPGARRGRHHRDRRGTGTGHSPPHKQFLRDENGVLRISAANM